MGQRLVVVGGGFAGLWAAAAAARQRALAGASFEIVLVAPDPCHVIRVRCYEADLSDIRIPLDTVLAPIGVNRVEARVEGIDLGGRGLALGTGETLRYDRLVLAPGSELVRPACPGAERCLDVDTYAGAQRLARHIAALPVWPARAARWCAVIVGAGLVGLELACELPGRLAKARAACPDADHEEPVRVVLVDRASGIAAAMGAAAHTIRRALAQAGVETRPDRSLRSIEPEAVVLSDGERIPAATVVAATGQRASPLAAGLPTAHDAFGRLPVDAFLGIEDLPGLYAAGNVARAAADEHGHHTVMSCQHARPMGRLAGHNAACDLLGLEDQRIAFAAPDYVTVLDLGDAGAVYTSGWDRGTLVADGSSAKQTKRTINASRIYPPKDGNAEAILSAAAPIIQTRPGPRR